MNWKEKKKGELKEENRHWGIEGRNRVKERRLQRGTTDGKRRRRRRKGKVEGKGRRSLNHVWGEMDWKENEKSEGRKKVKNLSREGQEGKESSVRKKSDELGMKE